MGDAQVLIVHDDVEPFLRFAWSRAHRPRPFPAIGWLYGLGGGAGQILARDPRPGGAFRLLASPIRGGGADVLRFLAPGEGTDRVMGLTSGEDRIEISASGFEAGPPEGMSMAARFFGRRLPAGAA